MKLLLRRSHRAGLFHRVIYALDVRADLDREEMACVRSHGLAGTRLYERLEIGDRGKGILGLAFRTAFKTTNLTVSVGDLIYGKRVEFADLAETLAVEDELKRAAQTFNYLVSAAIHFDGEELLEL